MSLETTGKLHKIFDTESKSDKFKSREFVIETAGQYPQLIKFQLVQDRCEIINAFRIGQDLKVYFDLRGREWNDKFFTSLQAWRVEPNQAGQSAQTKSDDTGINGLSGNESDMPF